jgi:hypothetical protein
MSRNNITANYVRERLEYNHETGVFLWLSTKSTRVSKGDVAGYTNDSGYRVIRFMGHIWRAHRLAWLYMYGEMPDGEIDHINHDRADNRISNLRIVDRGENARNTSLRSDNKTGYCGVRKQKNGKYSANISKNGVSTNIGTFLTIEGAAIARQQAELRMGFHPNHGEVA